MLRARYKNTRKEFLHLSTALDQQENKPCQVKAWVCNLRERRMPAVLAPV